MTYTHLNFQSIKKFCEFMNIDMFLNQIRILLLCLTTALAAANHLKQDSTVSRINNSTVAKKEQQYLANNISNKRFHSKATNAMPTENEIIIEQEHNLLGILMSIITRLMDLRSLKLGDFAWELLSRIFAAFMSLLFGPNINLLWPQFLNIAVPFLKLLTA